jgi:cytochrome c-type biogenesis protein CcmH
VRRLLPALLLIAPLLVPAPAPAGEATPTEQDPVAARRSVKLAEELRCLVCQNQSIAESNAELALDLRRQINEQIAAGRSDREIVDFMVQRYGDFVLYRPPLKATTLVLWSGPFLLLVAGVIVLLRTLRARRRRAAEEPPLTDEERRRAEALLAGNAEEPRP